MMTYRFVMIDSLSPVNRLQTYKVLTCTVNSFSVPVDCFQNVIVRGVLPIVNG